MASTKVADKSCPGAHREGIFRQVVNIGYRFVRSVNLGFDVATSIAYLKVWGNQFIFGAAHITRPSAVAFTLDRSK